MIERSNFKTKSETPVSKEASETRIKKSRKRSAQWAAQYYPTRRRADARCRLLLRGRMGDRAAFLGRALTFDVNMQKFY
jgi:hypothetical protein